MSFVFNIKDNKFTGNASLLKVVCQDQKTEKISIHCNGMTVSKNTQKDFTEILKEISEIKAVLNPDVSIYQALEDLENAVKENNKKKIKKTVMKHETEFTSSVFFKLASSTLFQLVQSYL